MAALSMLLHSSAISPAIAVEGAAPRRALQSACFAPAALQAIPGEQIAKKGDRSFSTPLSRKAPLISAAPVPDHLRGSIRSVALPPGLKLVALTFDLCEDNYEIAGYEGRIFDTLRKENVKATLFAGGKWMRSHEARTRQLMSDPLFEIANHAEAHRNLRMLRPDVLQDEILGPQRSYELIRQRFSEAQCAAAQPEAMQSLPPRISLFRFPYGACHAESMKAVNDAGLLAIQWDVSIGDPSPGTKPAAMIRAMKTVKPGSIIIGHANGRGWHTADALPAMIAELKKQGFQFVTVSEMLAAGTPVIADTCYNSQPGDTERYDRFPALLASRKQTSGSGWGVLEVKPAGKTSKRTRKM
jgi:peptidoglycan/xylan/chitin deacetylase (PgdA/CDA1 family)